MPRLVGMLACLAAATVAAKLRIVFSTFVVVGEARHLLQLAPEGVPGRLCDASGLFFASFCSNSRLIFGKL